MGDFDTYKIDLKGLQTDSCHYEFVLDDSFFAGIENSELQGGLLNVSLDVKKKSQAFELTFDIKGSVKVVCDRCLDEMDQPIGAHDALLVKFGDEYEEVDDNLVVVPETEGIIDVAWRMYEMVILSIPMKHVHASGECNQLMYDKLHEHLRYADEDMEGDEWKSDADHALSGDSPWKELKKILDNN